MKIVLTGALGHIGSRLIRDLPHEFDDLELLLIDNLSTMRFSSLFDLDRSHRYRFVEADVLETDLDAHFSGADIVIHLAAITDAAGSFVNRDQVKHVNFNATRCVADACARQDCRMLFVSSTSVYGTQDSVVDELCPPAELKPQSPYAETKLREERYLVEAEHGSRLNYVVCRFGTICGVSPGMRFHTAVNKFCWQAVMAQPITVWKTALHQRRPYLDLFDAVRAMSHIIRRDLFDRTVYNVLTGNHTVHDILEYVGRDVPTIETEFVEAAIMNQLSYDVSRQRFQDTGFEFAGSVSDAVHQTLSTLSGICNAHG